MTASSTFCLLITADLIMAYASPSRSAPEIFYITVSCQRPYHMLLSFLLVSAPRCYVRWHKNGTSVAGEVFNRVTFLPDVRGFYRKREYFLTRKERVERDNHGSREITRGRRITQVRWLSRRRVARGRRKVCRKVTEVVERLSKGR